MHPWSWAPALAGALVITTLLALTLAPVRVRVRLRLRAQLDAAGAVPGAAGPGQPPPSPLPAPWPWGRGAVVAQLSVAGLQAVGRGRAWATPQGWRAQAAAQARAGPLTLRQWRHRARGPGEDPWRTRAPRGGHPGRAARPHTRREGARRAVGALWGTLAERLAWERLHVRLRVGTGEAMGTALTAGALRAAAMAAAARLPGARAFTPRLRLEVWPDFRRPALEVEVEAAASIRAGQAAAATLAALRAATLGRPAPQRAKAHTAWP